MVENARLNKYVAKLEAKNLIFETYLQGLNLKLDDTIMQKARLNEKKLKMKQKEQQDAFKAKIAELESQLKSQDQKEANLLAKKKQFKAKKMLVLNKEAVFNQKEKELKALEEQIKTKQQALSATEVKVSKKKNELKAFSEKLDKISEQLQRDQLEF